MKKFEKIAPEASKISKENPFRVPDHYFDDFSARMHTRLKAETEVRKQPRNPVVRYLKPALGLAASFLLVFLLVYWPISEFLPQYLSKSDAPVETITDDDHYFNYIEKIDENSFIALIAEPDTDKDIVDDDFSDEDLLSYLSANISDFELFAHTQN